MYYVFIIRLIDEHTSKKSMNFLKTDCVSIQDISFTFHVRLFCLLQGSVIYIDSVFASFLFVEVKRQLLISDDLLH